MYESFLKTKACHNYFYNIKIFLLKFNFCRFTNYFYVFILFTKDIKYFLHILEKTKYIPYQNGYYRRSFRFPNNKKLIFKKQLNILRNLSKLPNNGKYSDTIYYDLDILEQIRYDNVVINPEYSFLLWSAYIDLGNDEVYNLIENIIYNRDEVGKVSRNIIKALLSSDQEKCFCLVKNLLLSAQREEGLRQVIIESLDECSIKAMPFMIDVILKNDLTRFSSVVRGVDVWMGLGFGAEKQKTINEILNCAFDCFKNPESIQSYLKSKNNLEVYVALWTIGVFDIEKTTKYLFKLLDSNDIEKKCLACKFALEIQNPNIELPIYFKALDAFDLKLYAIFAQKFGEYAKINFENKYFLNNPKYPNIFEKVYDIYKKINVNSKKFEGVIFSGNDLTFKKEYFIEILIYLCFEEKTLKKLLLDYESFLVDTRKQIIYAVLGNYRDLSKIVYLNDFKKEFTINLLQDKSESIRDIGVKILKNINLSEVDLSLLKEKITNSNTKNILDVVLSKSDKIVNTFIENNFDNPNIIFEILVFLKKQKKVYPKSKDFALKLLDLDITDEQKQVINELYFEKKQEKQEKKYGFFTPGIITKYELHKIDKDSNYLANKQNVGFSKSVLDIKKDLSKLHEIYKTNKDYEYEVEEIYGEKSKVILGNNFRELKYIRGLNNNGEELFKNYPLYDIWEKWFIESNLTNKDIFLLKTFINFGYYDEISFFDYTKYILSYSDIMPSEISKLYDYYWKNPILKIIECLNYKYNFEANDFIIDLYADLFGSFNSKIILFNDLINNNYRGGWQTLEVFNLFFNKIDFSKLTDDNYKKLWNIYRFRQFNGLKENISKNFPPFDITLKAFDLGIIGQDEFLELVFTNDGINYFCNLDFEKNDFVKSLTKVDILKDLKEKITSFIVGNELKRQELECETSIFLKEINKFYGSEIFLSAIKELKNNKIHKGWFSNILIKNQALSYILANTLPLESDKQEDFNQKVATYNISEKRLLEAVFYNISFLDFVANYLGWNGLKSGVWWFIAHTKGIDSSNTPEFESEVSKYSTFDFEDFKSGVCDKNWFFDAYNDLGKQKMDLLYESCKYISDNNGAARSKLYFDAFTGEISFEKLSGQISKRHNDSVRAIGLCSFDEKNLKKDIIKRYEIIKNFEKGIKEFGAQRQATEKLTTSVGYKNLAINAGYKDFTRLSWFVDSHKIENIFKNESQITIDETVLNLAFDDFGKAEIIVNKGGKVQKTIPSDISKNELVLKLKENKKTLENIFKDAKTVLEDAMINREIFEFSELQEIFKNPVLKIHLEKLVFLGDDKNIGFLKLDGDILTFYDYEKNTLQNPSILKIVHPYDLLSKKVWEKYQSYCFENQIIQPFKQIFRELYVPTDDELNSKNVSNRYAGYQVQPKKALALFKSRGWKANYEEGLQKSFLKHGFVVGVSCMFDWFTPSDIEAPTLENIYFWSLKKDKVIDFESIDKVIFSEIMRDLDLVVSVAFAGGVDVESSYSSMEMRGVLVRETCKLFKLDNVKVEGSFVKIVGNFSNYNIHLGSGIVHKSSGQALNIIAVHSSHRGKIFLPFMDEEPKTSEILSKVISLARDNLIKDPTILKQIMGN